ncbi:MAG: arginine--tRNA ligase [Bacteroidota bacterium]|nr:arginine--tRNA ligase [Bacteroidota bacterium]
MKKYLYNLFAKASEKYPGLKNVSLSFEVPKVESFGDYSTNAAMLLTKELKKNPRIIAQEIIDAFELDKNVIEKIEIAGPGFINFFFNPAYIPGIVKEISSKVDNFGKSDINTGKTANVEFVSANPTGPLTVGHGRNAILGDTVANILEWTGYKVDREYYFNNAGRQMRVLGESVKYRYLQILGDDVELPDTHYQGEYIKEIAQELIDEKQDSLRDETAEGIFKAKAEEVIFKDIKNTLESLNVIHNLFYNEDSLYKEGKIKALLKAFGDKNLIYEKDGAVWFKFTEFGKENDKVIVKATGEPTYRLPDIAYHITKFERNYDLIIDVFGSDHNDTYPDVKIGLQEMGYDINKVKVLIHQFVTILEDGEIVKMSTRKANYITLDQLIEEVGKDVVRYFFNMRDISSHMNFDLSLAKKQSDENPVFYLQYALARICSVLNLAEKVILAPSYEHLDLLKTNEEQQLLKLLYKFEEEIEIAASLCEPHRICNYLENLATGFHRFYTFCRVLGVEKELSEARIALIIAVKIVIKNGLTILGVSAPDRM